DVGELLALLLCSLETDLHAAQPVVIPVDETLRVTRPLLPYERLMRRDAAECDQSGVLEMVTRDVHARARRTAEAELAGQVVDRTCDPEPHTPELHAVADLRLRLQQQCGLYECIAA